MGSEAGNEETTAKKSESDEKKIRYEITEKIFDEILKANLHQSEIAARLLIPVAFLTAAAVTLFRFFQENVSVKLMEVEVIPILFLFYILCTLGGILVFFEVIGPSFYMKIWPLPKKKQKGPKSALFFKLIAEIDIDRWISYFCEKNTEHPEEFLENDELRDKLIYDFAVESSLLAKKAQKKVKDNLLAHLFFYPSFCFLLLMAFTGIFSYLGAKNWIILIPDILIVHVFGIIEYKVFKKYRGEVRAYEIGLRGE